MLFNSISYVIFLPIIFLLYWTIPNKYKWLLLLTASYYFYMNWDAKYAVLIFITTLISYISGLLISKYPQCKKIYATLPIVICLLILIFFKYLQFLFDILNTCFIHFSIPLDSITFSILLPVGISFYTFQSLGYIIDVYRGDIEAETHFGKYATFVAFFPQLVAGPIERSTHLLPQIKKVPTFDYQNAIYGIKLMAWGFFQKIVIADSIAEKINIIFANLENYKGFSILLACLLFSIQIYCDFGGYSNIAIGSAKLFGINLSINFKSPYFSTNFSEFWSKWHISLSTWFKDYVYIPLGGNRNGSLITSRNLVFTFMLSGLWHGANWNFILWGCIHGFMQVIERLFCKHKKCHIQKSNIVWLIKCTMFFCLITITWIFFRVHNIGEITYIFQNMFAGFSSPLTYIKTGFKSMFSVFSLIQLLIPCCLLVIFDYFNVNNDTISLISTKNTCLRWIIYIAFMFTFFACYPYVSNSEFVYFQF